MNFTRKVFFLLVFGICFGHAFGQNSVEKISLSEAFERIETDFDYTFSYKDADLKNHIIFYKSLESISETLSRLEANTLFTFTLLKDNTIAVSKKANIITVCGKLLNTTSRLPIEDVIVSTPFQEVVTTTDGIFNAEVINADISIEIIHPKYETKELNTRDLLEKPCKNIFLSERITTLDPVTITNYLAKGIQKNRNGAVTVNYENFDILPGLIESDVLLTIQALPGIQSVNETVSYINIRGGTNDQNLILWDGIKMYQSGHFFGLISAFNPYLTKKVSIIKNGSSARYGDGVSGIIDIKGDENGSDKLEAGLGINLISADAYVATPLGKKASLEVSGRTSINSILETPTYRAYFNKVFQNTEVISNSDITTSSDEDFTFFDTNIRFLFMPSEKETVRVNFLAISNRLDFLENATVSNATQSRLSELSQNNLSSGLFYERMWNDRLKSEIQFYGTSYNLEAVNFDILNGQRLIQKNEIIESGIKLQSNYLFSKKISGLFGYQFNETGITNFEEINIPFFSRTDKQVLRTHSLFSEFEIYPFLEKTNITLGLRVNYLDKFDKFLWEPRLSFNHRFSEHFTFELLGELKSQTTSQVIDFQNDFLGVENRRWVLSNEEDIPIIMGKQLSAGLTFKKRGWLASVEMYLKEIDGITSQSQGFQNQFLNIRTHGSYTVQGADVLMTKEFKNISTWLSYSYAENTYTFNEFTPQQFPNNIDIRHTVTYGINYVLNNLKLSGGFNWHSGKPNTLIVADNEIVGGEINYGPPNGSNIKDYIRVDVSALYNFGLGKGINGVAGVSIWNLFNTKNVVNHFYLLDQNNNWEEISENALEFTPNFSLRLLF